MIASFKRFGGFFDSIAWDFVVYFFFLLGFYSIESNFLNWEQFWFFILFCLEEVERIFVLFSLLREFIDFSLFFDDFSLFFGDFSLFFGDFFLFFDNFSLFLKIISKWESFSSFPSNSNEFRGFKRPNLRILTHF